MSYESQAQLAQDPIFNQRNAAACTQQATTYQGSGDAQVVALADAVLRDDGGVIACFTRMAAAGPGVADKVEQPNGGVDQTQVTDADLLSLTQANWIPVAKLYFAADGTPLT
jgi:hypothetical protein